MYKIDTKEFESCMLELFGNKDDSTNYPLLWLTTSGKFLYNKLNEEYFHFTHTYVYQRLFTTAFTDKHLKLDSQKELYHQHGIINTHPPVELMNIGSVITYKLDGHMPYI